MTDGRLQGLAALILALISGGLAQEVARSKGRDPWRWFLAGFLFGPLGLIAIAGIADRKNHMLLARIAQVSRQIEDDIEQQSRV